MAPTNHEHTVTQALANRYQNTEKTKRDVMTALHNYRGLAPKLDKFVFRSGNSRYLLCLDGTIPVTYKGATYNIPVCIWLLDNHPFSSPMVFVKPTHDMLIKASRHVDQNGKVYLPYLHEWNMNSSDLPGLIQLMIMTFSEMPPVYSKPKNAAAAPAAGPQGYPPPYPANTPGGFMGMPGAQSGGLPYPTGPGAAQPYPPYPTQPGYPPSNTPYPVYPPTSTPGYPPTTTGNQPAYPPPYAATGYPPYPPTTTAFNAQSADVSNTNSATPAPAATATGTITEEHIRASLISAVSDNVRARLREMYSGAQAEIMLRLWPQVFMHHRSTRRTSGNGFPKAQGQLNPSHDVVTIKTEDIKNAKPQGSETTSVIDLNTRTHTDIPLYKFDTVPLLLGPVVRGGETHGTVHSVASAERRE
ncbi:unnamed protein product, partial [Meganyctiphanes norvegica]